MKRKKNPSYIHRRDLVKEYRREKSDGELSDVVWVLLVVEIGERERAVGGLVVVVVVIGVHGGDVDAREALE